MRGSRVDIADRPLELWGGVECTIARIGEEYRDQVTETGHLDRPGDIDLIDGLGIRTVRYPIIWESIAPDDPDKLDFSWDDTRLKMLRERGVEVIGGLLHHGSGPSYTSLLDPEFPDRFAAFAAKAAERYPWIGKWTPVNEPLTTARFSGLYGHWYPHAHTERAYLRALVNQCLGTLKAMRAIRAFVPDATLVQTEDLGKTFSTAKLRYQAAHENGRRWLSFDLLAGRVTKRHPFYRRLIDNGIMPEELELLQSGEAAPDIIGINHYLTSERFLDHRTELYPSLQPGGNGRDRYVDAEAVRVKRLHLHTGIGPRIREAWERYRIPIAITEVHHGCTRDEQLRWFAEVWNSCRALREEGVDVRAVTLWSLFGNVDWRSLLTRREGVYDVGAFDTRSREPRPTAIAHAATAFAQGRTFDHPVLDSKGWWRRPARLYPWHGQCKSLGEGDPRKLLITGATGTLGRAFARICEHRGLSFCLTGREDLDITSARSIARAIRRYRPWAIVNAAGFVRVADAENEQDACLDANAAGPRMLAKACAEAGLPLVTFSSDLVFDGNAGRAYHEEDRPNPACVYGVSKAEAEQGVLALWDKALVIRTSAFFGPWDRYNFAWNVLNQLARGEPVQACRNTIISPTYVPDLVHAALDLLIDGESGIWHLANQGQVSWHGFARAVAEGANLNSGLVLPMEGAPANTALTSSRGLLLRPLDQAIGDYVREVADMIEPVQQMDVAAE